MIFTWDPVKSRNNVTRPGIAFDDAIRIFEGRTREKIDDRFDYGEIRVYAVGLVNGLEIAVIYPDTSAEERRIISAWRSERNEREAYWQSES